MSINSEYKQRFAELAERLGRNPTTKDKEYWELTDWMKDQWEQDPTFRQSVKEEKKMVDGEIMEIMERPMNSTLYYDHKCRNCDSPIERTGKRGRPPVVCGGCK